jgi:hypothetical protein
MNMFSFVETRVFSRLVREYLSDDEYRALQTVLIEDPEAGPVIPGSGGVRKLRLDVDDLPEERRWYDPRAYAEKDP